MRYSAPVVASVVQAAQRARVESAAGAAGALRAAARQWIMAYYLSRRDTIEDFIAVTLGRC